MKIKPILMKGEEVRAVLDGRKTMMRRPIKIQPPGPEWQMAKLLDGPKKNIGKHYWVRLNESGNLIEEADYRYFSCPYEPGDLLWVRETWSTSTMYDRQKPSSMEECYLGTIRYLADGFRSGKIRPGIHMPRWASRLTLRITDIRAERLQDISEEDAIAEGIELVEFNCFKNYLSGTAQDEIPGSEYLENPVGSFASLWKYLYGPESWGANPMVLVEKFEPINSNVDEA